MKPDQNIKKLREGDTVLFFAQSVKSIPREVKVQKVTRNRLLISGVYFDRSKGYACGHGQNPFPPAFAIPGTIKVATQHPFPTSEDVPAATVRKVEKKLAEVQELVHNITSGGN